jgi:hypothetical protein
MIEKTEDAIFAECIRVLKEHQPTRHVTSVPIVAVGPGGTLENWTYGVITPRLDADAAEAARVLIMSVAARWSLKD